MAKTGLSRQRNPGSLRPGTDARLPLVALLLSFCIGSTGCTRLYSRTWAQLPAAPAAEVDLRLDEARQAGKNLQQAAVRLRASLEDGALPASIQIDFDRLEAAAFEFERRALAAADAAARSEKPEEFASHIRGSRAAAQSWLDYVHSNRTAEAARQLLNLQAVIDAAGPVPTP